MPERMEQRVGYATAQDGCRLWTARTGPERAAGREPHGFVLSHGGPGFWDTLGPVAAMLDDLGPVVRWDQRGGGRSQWQGPYTAARFVADLDRVRAEHGFEEVTLLGHSWGATLSLLYALEHPERIRRLMYVSGSGLGQGRRAERDARTRAALEPYAARIAVLEALPERTPEQERELWQLGVAAEFPDRSRALEYAATQVAELFDEDEAVNGALTAEVRSWPEAEWADRCRGLAVPTLIVDGAADLRPRWAVDSLAEVLPTCTRVSLPGAGHFPWLDRPAELSAVLRDFVRAHRPAG